MSELAIIKSALDCWRKDCSRLYEPKVVDADFDFSKFERQDTDIDGADYELVDQRGPGICDDDFHGWLAVPIGDQFFLVEYDC